MESLEVCQLSLASGVDPDAFERSVLEEVFPAAGDRPRKPEWVFVRTLYRHKGRLDAPSTYMCSVRAWAVSDSRFHAMRGALTELGAELSDVRYWGPLRLSVPEPASAFEDKPDELLDCRLRLPFDRNADEFEQVLSGALAEAVQTGQTRANRFDAFRVYRDDDAGLGAVGYLCRAVGFIYHPELFRGTARRLRDAGAEIVESAAYTHVGTLSGGAFPPP